MLAKDASRGGDGYAPTAQAIAQLQKDNAGRLVKLFELHAEERNHLADKVRG